MGRESDGGTDVRADGFFARSTELSLMDDGARDIDLFALWDLIWEGKWIIVACTVLCAALAVIKALNTDDVYEARVVVVPADDEGAGGLSGLASQFGGLASLAGINLGGGGRRADEALQRLKSHSFTQGFVVENELMPELYPDIWDSVRGEWTVDAQAVPSVLEAVRRFSSIRKISSDRQTGVTTVTVAWCDPELAAQWANALVQRLNEEQRQREIEETQRSIAFLRHKLKETDVLEMQQTLYRLIEAQTKSVMLANVREDYAFRVIDPAFVAEERSGPNRRLIVIIGAFIGGVLGVILVSAQSVVSAYRGRGASDV